MVAGLDILVSNFFSCLPNSIGLSLGMSSVSATALRELNVHASALLDSAGFA